MVKDHSDSERKEGNVLFNERKPTDTTWATLSDRIVHTTAFVTPVVKHWLEWEIAKM